MYSLSLPRGVSRHFRTCILQMFDFHDHSAAGATGLEGTAETDPRGLSNHKAKGSGGDNGTNSAGGGARRPDDPSTSNPRVCDSASPSPGKRLQRIPCVYCRPTPCKTPHTHARKLTHKAWPSSRNAPGYPSPPPAGLRGLRQDRRPRPLPRLPRRPLLQPRPPRLRPRPARGRVQRGCGLARIHAGQRRAPA